MPSMSRVRDKADFQFAGEDYTHGAGVKYVANMIQTTDLDASGTITNIHLQDIADVAAVSASNDGYYPKYDSCYNPGFAWSQVSGGGGGTMNDSLMIQLPQLGGTLDANSFNIDMGNNIDRRHKSWLLGSSIQRCNPSGGTIGGNPIITGNFVVNGTQQDQYAESLVSDNIITSTSDVTGTPRKTLV